MRQFLVECSEPGLVVSLDEELEHVLRNVDFKNACELKLKLSKLAHSLGSDFIEVWSGFHMEVANDGYDNPPSFGNRNKIDSQKVKDFVDRAAKDGIGKFKVRSTLLLPQGGQAPETQEQFVHDLGDSIRYAACEEGKLSRCSFTFPKTMEQ